MKIQNKNHPKSKKIDRCPKPMGIRVWKIELRELENYGTFALWRAKKVHQRWKWHHSQLCHLQKIWHFCPQESPKSVLEMDMASFIALLFAKNMALLPLGEPKIGTEKDLAPRARKTTLTRMKNHSTSPCHTFCRIQQFANIQILKIQHFPKIHSFPKLTSFQN